MGNSRSHTALRLRSGPTAFTLVEMLVAVAMGAALVAAASTVFSLATEAIGTSEANTEVNSQLRVLFSWLDRDFARIRLDGYLVLNPQDDDLNGDGGTPDERFDQVYFMISGNIPSTDMAFPNYNAGLAIVSYGPDDTVGYALPLAEAYDWIFTRRAILIVSDTLPIPTDTRQSSFADLLSGSVAANNIWNEITLPANRSDFGYNNTSGTYTFPDTDELPTYLVGNVTRFEIVQYYMAGAAGPVTLDPALPPVGFGPNAEKPAWIEFEVVLRDSNGRLEEGFTAMYRVNLPSR